MSMPTEKVMRTAIAARDSGFDGRFIYAVITTGVFCRPSCAARAPRSENLRFFQGSAEAIAAGFRACKRCRPLQPSAAAAIADIAAYITANFDAALPLDLLATRAGLSSGRLQKAFKAALGVTPKAYQVARRVECMKASLQSGGAVTTAILDAGYGSSSRAYSKAHSLGMTPKTYRAGGAGETIAYACRNTSLGALLMGATDIGVCFAHFGDSETALLAQLTNEFPNAQLVRSSALRSPELDAWIAALDAHISHGKSRPDLPLDLRGTAFQIRVWRFLLSVQTDVVLSYGELAAQINAPKAVRAAASACAANKIAVLVPCHLVLRGNGGLGGYRWGLARKRSLLASVGADKVKSDVSIRPNPPRNPTVGYVRRFSGYRPSFAAAESD